MGALVSTAAAVGAAALALLAALVGLGGSNRDALPPGQQRFFVPAPKFFWYLALLNRLGTRLEAVLGVRLLPFEPQTYIDIGKSATPAGAETHFGPQDEFQRGLRLVVHGLAGAPTSVIGRVILRFMIPRLMAARKNVMQYVVEHPEVTQIKIQAPVIVFGLPRTGSTLLHHLLAEDPNTRAPQFWEMYHSSDPMPPATKEEFATHPRRAAVKKRLLALDDLAPGMVAEMSKSHVMDADQIDEELVFLMQQMFLANFLTMCGPGEYLDWALQADNKKFIYLYMLRFIQALHSANPPKKHWTLKSPMHALFIGTLLETFPDARIVTTHRDLANVVPSLCKYFENMSSYFLEDHKLDRRIFGRIILHIAETITARMKAFRAQHAAKQQFFDVKYEDLIKDQIGTVKRIYDHFGMDFTPEYEHKLREYIKNNPQGKHGRAQYEAEDYGLNPDKLREQFKDYAQTYL